MTALRRPGAVEAGPTRSCRRRETGLAAAEGLGGRGARSALADGVGRLDGLHRLRRRGAGRAAAGRGWLSSTQKRVTPAQEHGARDHAGRVGDTRSRPREGGRARGRWSVEDPRLERSTAGAAPRAGGCGWRPAGETGGARARSRTWIGRGCGERGWSGGERWARGVRRRFALPPLLLVERAMPIFYSLVARGKTVLAEFTGALPKQATGARARAPRLPGRALGASEGPRWCPRGRLRAFASSGGDATSRRRRDAALGWAARPRHPGRGRVEESRESRASVSAAVARGRRPVRRDGVRASLVRARVAFRARPARAARTGNFPTVTRVLLNKIDPRAGDQKMSYTYDQCVRGRRARRGGCADKAPAHSALPSALPSLRRAGTSSTSSSRTGSRTCV